MLLCGLNTLRPKQNGHHFADDIFKCILLNENVWIPNKISLKFVPKGRINNIPPLVQMMTWRPSGDKPLSEPMMVSSLTHICVTRVQWVNYIHTDTEMSSSWPYLHLSQSRSALRYFHFSDVVTGIQCRCLSTPFSQFFSISASG